MSRGTMEPRRTPEYSLDISADRSSVKDVVKGVLHTIFFHRYFTPLYPATHEILDLTLPYTNDEEIETLVEKRTTSLIRALDNNPTSATTSPQYKSSSNGGTQRAQITLQFLEKKRRKGWFTTKPDEDIPWETWTIDITVLGARGEVEAARNRRLMGRSLERAVLNVIEVVNRERGHIPPITTNETNPFPYHIAVSTAGKAGMF